jgi:ankyrin repeat protein
MMSRLGKRAAVAFLLCSTTLTAQRVGRPPVDGSVAPDRAPASTEVEAFYTAIRNDDLKQLESMLKAGGNVNAVDPRGGATPLMYAAVAGSIEAMRLLIDHKANVNQPNSGGATALIWAAGDLQRVRVLLAGGADPNAASQRGRTALYVAAKNPGSTPIVKMLIEAGADPKVADSLKSTPLHAAVVANDIDTIRTLVAAGADVNATDVGGFVPIIDAAGNNNIEAVTLFLGKGANVNARSGDGSYQKVKAGTIALGYFTPLIAAAAYGSPRLVQLLLDAGADVNAVDIRGMTPLMLAVATDRQNADVIRMLLTRGANVNAKSTSGETALDWARKIGAPDAIEILRKAGGVETAHDAGAVPPAAPADLKTSIGRSLSLLSRMSVTSAANGGCASCHSHNIVDMAESAARVKGFASDAKLTTQRQALTLTRYFSLTSRYERLDGPVPEIDAYALLALYWSGYTPDRTTDSIATILMAQQWPNGSWSSGVVARPPIEDGDIFRTALGVRAISIYVPPARSAEAKVRVARARAWLEKARAETAEDRNMQLLGLHWAGAAQAEIAPLVKSILARQRPDGGWSQTDHLTSDAYATGQSLYALAGAGNVKADHPAFKKGVAFLLSTQRADGSWYVKSRSPKFQPFFEGGFPYGHNQWISSMATGWATAALTHAVPAAGRPTGGN